MEISEEFGEKGEMGKTLYNNTDQHEKVIDYNNNALENDEELGEVGETCRNTEDAYNNTGQHVKAIYCNRKALEIPEELSDKREVEKINKNMGDAYNNTPFYMFLNIFWNYFGTGKMIFFSIRFLISVAVNWLAEMKGYFSEAYEHDIRPGKNDAQAVNEEEPGANAQLKNSTQKNYVRDTIPLTVPEELTEILLSIDDIEGFGVVDEQLMINVFEDRQDAARESIKKTLEKFPAFTSDKWYIETWTETNCMKLHSNSAIGGFKLHSEKNFGTIGCLLQSLDGKIYGVTCDHVVDGLDNSSDPFSITVNKVTRTFPKENVLRMLKPDEAVDIALLPLNESCHAFDFEHDECVLYSGEINELMHSSVQKKGATTPFTEGNIMSVDYSWKLRVKMSVVSYKHLLLVASSSNAEFSKEGDSGSIVTLCKGDDETTHKAVSMVFGGGSDMVYRKQLRHTSMTLPLPKAMDLLQQKEENIGKGYVILSKLGRKTLDKSKENSKNTVGEKMHSETEASDRKLRRRKNTNEIKK